MGITTAIALGVGGGFAASKLMGGGSKQGMQAPLPMPQAPSPVDASAKAEDVIKKKRATASQSIYTSPLGVSGEAALVKKTLLGQ